MIPRSKHLIAGTLVSFGVAALLWQPAPASAAFSLQSLLGGITQSVSSLFAARQSPELSPAQIAAQELAARKDTVSRVFDLTLAEQRNLSDQLNQLQNLSPSESAMRDRLSSLLAENQASFTQIRARLDTAATADEVKQLAEDFKNWRTAVYDSKLEKIVAFAFVYQENSVLSTAESRASKVAEDIAVRPLGDAKDAANAAVGHARSDIQRAEDLHQQARTLLMIALNTSLSTTTLASAANDATVQRNIADAKLLTQQSYGFVADAYQIFIQLSAKLMR
ncbi:MAG: hypothetical protein KGI60_02410 [Patescibacteria group bacterium]|nr:hypothetical protein [Patescibacteria group bacterium]